MIELNGFCISNYYNKVKLVLLEKGIPFTENRVHPKDADEAFYAASPLGKVPFIRTPQGALSESQAIVDYLEALQPEPALLPADPWARAKVRELSTYIDLHVELVARELYRQAFFGGTLSDSTKERVGKQLRRNLAALKGLARFDPYVAGAEFTQADCSAYVSLPLAGLASRLVIGEDLVLAAGIDWKVYAKVVAPRPSAQRVDADRKLEQERLAAKAG